MRKQRVLFLCQFNTGRSRMAEAFLRALGGDRVEVFSAGLEKKDCHPLVHQVMREVGLDIAAQPKTIGELGATSFDLLVTLCDASREFCRLGVVSGEAPAAGAERLLIFNGVPLRLHWAIEDPKAAAGSEAERLAAFRQTRDQIRARVEALLDLGCLEALVEQRSLTERLLDALDDAVIAHDDFRRIYIFNRAAEAVTGLARADVLGRDCHAVFPPDGLCGGQCGFRLPAAGGAGGAGAAGASPNRGEYLISFITPAGEKKRLKVFRMPLEVRDGRPHGAVAVIHDVTEVSELRWRLRREKSFRGMVGVSKAMREVFETIRLITGSDYPVLITGESGTGKELVANAIHNESRRHGGPFVPINCGALPEQILESELFGHVRGAFTGAIRTKKGRFELADHGTLFLDEVAELPPAFQVKLLRVLQEQRFEPVGGEQPIRVDVRIISATNKDPRRLVREGKFREDLFYRLCVVPISLPPLRERREDLPLLVAHVLEQIRQETGKPLREVSPAALELLAGYPWPGNIRELINALQFAAVRCLGERLEPAHLPPEIRLGTWPVPPGATGEPPASGAAAAAPAAATGAAGASRPKKLDREAVRRALAAAGGSKVRAAQLLGVGRATLYRFLKEEGEADAAGQLR